MATTVDFSVFTIPGPPPEPLPPFQDKGLICWSYDSTDGILTTVIKEIGANRGYRGGARTRVVLPVAANPVALRLLALDRTWLQGLDINMQPIVGASLVVEPDPDNPEDVSITHAGLRAVDILCDSEMLLMTVTW